LIDLSKPGLRVVFLIALCATPQTKSQGEPLKTGRHFFEMLF